MIGGRKSYVIYSPAHYNFTPDAHRAHLFFGSNKQSGSSELLPPPKFISGLEDKEAQGRYMLTLVASITILFPYNLKHIIRGYSLYNSQVELSFTACIIVVLTMR